jgi:hypothetical protein
MKALKVCASVVARDDMEDKRIKPYRGVGYEPGWKARR